MLPEMHSNRAKGLMSASNLPWVQRAMPVTHRSGLRTGRSNSNRTLKEPPQSGVCGVTGCVALSAFTRSMLLLVNGSFATFDATTT
ncbi:hypothetical protein DOTSEDRAFT_75359 [Dothistroma septosporum NZE10]|uniref:Uncharacterized protein n=1 Tax=Dothistroma septosporum (strain NZE10 / CBS 128990) TaxID=675120 RepID=M2Y318_DOTSN|nr:hypothetical protein DOTSEDRAFT_75359 [Dothistroma septosporum NZE10]